MELPHSDCIIGLVNCVKTLFDKGINIPFSNFYTDHNPTYLHCFNDFQMFGNRAYTKRKSGKEKREDQESDN